jgi:hypothetical protein
MRHAYITSRGKSNSKIFASNSKTSIRNFIKIRLVILDLLHAYRRTSPEMTTKAQNSINVKIVTVWYVWYNQRLVWAYMCIYTLFSNPAFQVSYIVKPSPWTLYESCRYFKLNLFNFVGLKLLCTFSMEVRDKGIWMQPQCIHSTRNKNCFICVNIASVAPSNDRFFLKVYVSFAGMVEAMLASMSLRWLYSPRRICIVVAAMYPILIPTWRGALAWR